jgi:hypothetical protein
MALKMTAIIDRTPLIDQGDASTGLFPGDFDELGKWFRPLSRPFPAF